ncbi:MAG: homoserine O-acetyltransferase, partial [Pseudomonadota bacterium]|nr:homoserine O-acetyltransferase [Pseudomonadota bacterium]
MVSEIPDNSVGLVKPLTQRFDSSITLQSGAKLPGFELVYETYGRLNEERDNAVLICHALSGHHHAAGYHAREDTKPGWWDNCIG